METQAQLFWEAHRKIADLNDVFMAMVNDINKPLTRSELEALIAKRPEVYGRFSNWLDKLGD